MPNQSPTYTILAPGFAKWRGCDPRALAQSFRKMGHNLLEIDAEDYIPWRWSGLLPRLLRRASVGILADEYNRAVIRQAESSSFDFVLVFKGMYLKQATVLRLRSFGKPVYNFYPDVSFTDHGPFIPPALRHYDCVFSSKSFHGEEELSRFKIREFIHVRHGFDPEVHRPLRLSGDLLRRYGCDVSFVGCWSPEKEKLIFSILRGRRDLKVVVYGIGWKYSSAGFKKALGDNLKPGVFGDELAIVYNASKVNLGLLSKAAGDPGLADQVTARTFQIPASGAFMLHQDTPEVRSYFHPEKEIMLFADEKDLLVKLDRALSDAEFRETIRTNSYARCMKEPYDYAGAAGEIIRKFEAGRR